MQLLHVLLLVMWGCAPPQTLPCVALLCQDGRLPNAHPPRMGVRWWWCVGEGMAQRARKGISKACLAQRALLSKIPLCDRKSPRHLFPIQNTATNASARAPPLPHFPRTLKYARTHALRSRVASASHQRRLFLRGAAVLVSVCLADPNRERECCRKRFLNTRETRHGP